MRAWTAFWILVGIILLFNFGPLLFSSCPSTTYGNSTTVVKYFSSPFCIACWQEKPIVQKVAAEENVSFAEYDVDFCRSAAAPRYIRAVPAFVLNDTIKYGLQTEEQLRGMVG